VKWLQHPPCKREFPGSLPGLDVSYERMKLGVANIKAKSALVHRSVCRCGQRNCDRPSLTRGPGSLRLSCDVKHNANAGFSDLQQSHFYAHRQHFLFENVCTSATIIKLTSSIIVQL
jgi:hypothetical protein